MTDLISRQAAQAIPPLPKCYREYATSNLDDAYDKGWEDALFSLNALPTIELKRERTWNGWEDGKGGTYLWDERVLDTQPSIGNIDSTSIVNCAERSEE